MQHKKPVSQKRTQHHTQVTPPGFLIKTVCVLHPQKGQPRSFELLSMQMFAGDASLIVEGVRRWGAWAAWGQGCCRGWAACWGCSQDSWVDRTEDIDCSWIHNNILCSKFQIQQNKHWVPSPIQFLKIYTTHSFHLYYKYNRIGMQLFQGQDPSQIHTIEQCFRVLYVDKRMDEIFVPSCVQFKIKNFTDVNFQNLSAQVNGVLCISFLVFTHNEHLENMLLQRLYWNPQELQILDRNRKKKIQREANFLPVTFNKDITVKIPTTRTKEFQIQAFKSRIVYEKEGKKLAGWRIFHIIRKEFTIQIIKSPASSEFFAPFNFINLDLTVSLDHMEIDLFEYNSKDNQERQARYVKEINRGIRGQLDKIHQQLQQDEILYIKRISFNNLRIQEPIRKTNLPIRERMRAISPMISCSTLGSYGKYDIVETKLQAYTFDEREVINLELDEEEKGNGKNIVFQDNLPTQLDFKPFKYAIFKIPLYRFPVVDMMTIFIPLWLLAFISIYVFYQTTEIMNRIINVAALMIAYAAIQPIVRQNLPDATSLTLVDLLIYMELFINILFLARSISIRDLYDDENAAPDPSMTNAAYDRWTDGLFVASVVITLVNVAIVFILIIIYLFRQPGYKGPKIVRKRFSISKDENWTLKLLMERSFARYRESILCFDDILGDKKNFSSSWKNIMK